MDKNRGVKIRTSVILMILIVSVVSPLTANISICPADQTKHLVSLDVCNSAGSFISACADFPSVNEAGFKPTVFEPAGFVEGSAPHFASSLFALQIEQPPRA